MNPHHHPYQGGLIEQAGYAKLKDFYGWHYVVGELNARAKRGHDEISALPEVRSRTVSMKHVERDVGIIVDVFNDAWSDNWGFVPATKNEVQKMASDFKLILEPEITRIVTIDGEPAAVAVALPNLNELARDLEREALPHRPLQAALSPQGSGPEERAPPHPRASERSSGTSGSTQGSRAFLYAELNDNGKKLGIEWGELGWTLEDNGPVNAGIRMMGAKPYKRYRVFDKAIAPVV